MVDRLNLKSITVGKGKMFGPEDYFSFSLLTIFIIIVILDRARQYKTYSFENLENVNIYNALKPSEVVKIYEDNEISPAEQVGDWGLGIGPIPNPQSPIPINLWKISKTLEYKFNY
jgi:hypothetical protein